MTIYYLVRHGNTQGIQNHLLQGSSDSPLSPLGICQSEKTARVLKGLSIQRCYSSPLGRALQTAEILCKPLKLEPEVMDDLREMNFGILENGQYFDLPNQYTKFIQKVNALGKYILANASGESLLRIRRRADRVWKYFLEQDFTGEILIVSHGVFIHELIHEIFKHTDVLKKRTYSVDACSITEIDLIDNQPNLIRLNDSSHLKGLKSA